MVLIIGTAPHSSAVRTIRQYSMSLSKNSPQLVSRKGTICIQRTKQLQNTERENWRTFLDLEMERASVLKTLRTSTKRHVVKTYMFLRA
jgi:hypothetical protein